MASDQLKEELEKFFGAWYDHKRQPDDPGLWEIYQNQISHFADLLEAEVGQQVDFSSIRRAYGAKFHAWIKEKKLPILPDRTDK